MDTDGECKIPFSRVSIFLVLFFTASIVATGGAMFAFADNSTYPRSPPILLKVVGLIGVVYFAPLFVRWGIRLWAGKPGLILNAQGILDNASNAAVGFIPWTDVVAASISEDRQDGLWPSAYRYFDLHVKNSGKYRRRGNLRHRLFRLLYGDTGQTRFRIPANRLDIGLEELEAVVRRYWERYGDRSP